MLLKWSETIWDCLFWCCGVLVTSPKTLEARLMKLKVTLRSTRWKLQAACAKELYVARAPGLKDWYLDTYLGT